MNPSTSKRNDVAGKLLVGISMPYWARLFKFSKKRGLSGEETYLLHYFANRLESGIRWESVHQFPDFLDLLQCKNKGSLETLLFVGREMARIKKNPIRNYFETPFLRSAGLLESFTSWRALSKACAENATPWPAINGELSTKEIAEEVARMAGETLTLELFASVKKARQRYLKVWDKFQANQKKGQGLKDLSLFHSFSKAAWMGTCQQRMKYPASKKQWRAAGEPFSFRLPKTGETDPYFDCSRTFWNEMTLGKDPAIKSFVRKESAAAKRGSRFILYSSAMAYFEGLANEEKGSANQAA